MEELQESEILWPDYHHHYHRQHRQNMCSSFKHKFLTNNNNNNNSTKPGARVTTSQPVGIPKKTDPTHRQGCWAEFEINSEEEKMVVPPHEMLERRFLNQKLAFSVCTGHGGRALKGRDLSKVRDSILRMTGFLETC